MGFTINKSAAGLDPFVLEAELEALSAYGDRVSVAHKKKSLLKFGRNKLVGTSAATIMTLPAGVSNETYISTNGINRLSSASTDIAGGIHGYLALVL